MSEVKSVEISAEQAEARRSQRSVEGPQVIPERDRILQGKQPMPESPTTVQKVTSPAEVERLREEKYAKDQEALREADRVREEKRVQRRGEAAIRLEIVFADRTYRGALPPEMDSSGLEGHSAGVLLGRLLVAAQARQFFTLEATERQALDPEDLVHGPVRRDGVMQPCPCASKSCLFARDARSWEDQVMQLVRQLTMAKLLVEVPKA